MILFLNFDGVLHPNTDDAAQFSCAPVLWGLLRLHRVTSVVFSAGWRFERPLDDLRWLVCAAGSGNC
jgi:hypothetical protein